MQSLSHLHIRNMLIGGYLQIFAEKETINSTNLFPIPDKDTGSNLVRTLRGIYESVSKGTYTTMEQLRHEALEAALVHAAGNAGIIMTSFLEGFLNTCTDATNSKTLQYALRVGSDHAYQSVQHPKSGTILDVMRAAALGVEHLRDVGEPTDVLVSAHGFAQKALNKTKTMAPTPLGTKVVDAGGLGFVALLQGFVQGVAQDYISAPILHADEFSAKSIVTLQEKEHEVVALIQDVHHSREEIMNILAQHGDSIDIVELYGKMKIHIHTDDPIKVRDSMSGFGTILESKTVNMNEGESPTAPSSIHSVGIVVDEGASLSRSYAQHHDICVIPFQFEWETHPNIDSSSLYATMRSIDRTKSSITTPKTSQPSPHTFLQAFKRELKTRPYLLCILTSSRVSGTWSSALRARDMLPSKDRERVYIPDLYQALGGHTLLVRRAVELVSKDTQVQNIIEDLTRYAHGIQVFGFGNDAYWLVKGGRLGVNAAKALTVMLKLGIQPVVGIKNGKLGMKGLVRKRPSIADMAYRYMIRRYRGSSENYTVVIHHGDISSEVSQLEEKLKQTNLRVVDTALLSPIVGVHIGPGAMVIAVGSSD